MARFELEVETTISRSPRARQVEALFDVPVQDKCSLKWNGEIPIDEKPWNVGLIVGPSGCGKSSVARKLFADKYEPTLKWEGASVIDDFAEGIPVAAIAAACSSVGFNTIPAWLRPYAVLSNGEKFRVEMARRLLEVGDPIVVDEFTSVVDRQVAQIGSYAVAKHVRRHKRKFVAVSCHYDIIEWLQPDWILEPATMDFRWRSVQPRPAITIQIARAPYALWKIFAPYHYLSAELSKAATCFAAFVDERPVYFTGVLHFPHPKVTDIKRLSRSVTLPDWQGVGIASTVSAVLGSAYKAIGYRLRSYPAHPAYVRTRAKDARWAMRKEPGVMFSKSATATIGMGQRPCAVFEYVGPAYHSKDDARKLISGN